MYRPEGQYKYGGATMGGDGHQQKPRRTAKEGQWVLRNPPCVLEPVFFSSRHGSKNPGFLLRPPSPYAIASLGVA